MTFFLVSSHKPLNIMFQDIIVPTNYQNRVSIRLIKLHFHGQTFLNISGTPESSIYAWYNVLKIFKDTPFLEYPSIMTWRYAQAFNPKFNGVDI